MTSLITTDIIRYQYPDNKKSYRSHVLHPQSDITIICIISSAKENITSVVEDHLLESISGSEWKIGEEDADFSYITESYNHFLTNLAVTDEQTVSIIFAVERNGHLMVSSIGESEVMLQEKWAAPNNIHEDTRGHHRFELISSWEIPVDSSVFIVSKNLEGTLWDSFYSDCANLESANFADITKEVLSREVQDTVHIIRIRRKWSHPIKNISYPRSENKIWNFGKEKMQTIKENFVWNEKLQSLRDRGHTFVSGQKKVFMTVFLLVGVGIFFALTSYLISALFEATGSQTQDAKNQIIKAKNLIESSQKLISNPWAFDATIKNAELILQELETKQLYAKDVKEQRDKIEALKKEIYDIQSINLDGKTSLIPFESSKVEPIAVYEKEKKLSVIGKKAMIYDYAVGDTAIKTKSYPSAEIVRDAVDLEDGNFYLLTESNQIIASRKNSDISYIRVNGQDGWEKADGISTFNGNIYLWNSAEWQIYKHRPGLNGFSNKVPVLPNPSPWIVDIGIDGGFYIAKSDQRITRFLSTSNTETGILLNKIPGEYTVWKNINQTKLIVRNELNYIYIVDGNRLWIFQPDAKRFQDIRSWTYIAQIEILSKDALKDITIARDGLMYILTEKWVYDVVFEFVDNNIILRS